MAHSIRWSVRDVVALSSILLLGGAAGLGAFERARETANRVKCASNLKQIGMAFLLYSNENRGAYPRTTMNRDNPTPTWGTPYTSDKEPAPTQEADPFAKAQKDPPASPAAIATSPADNDVTAALYLLLRTQDLIADVFVCPSSRQAPWKYGKDGEHGGYFTNWTGKTGLARHLSYSYQNPYPSAAAVAAGFKLNNSITAEFATLSDLNPGGETVTKVTLKSPQAEVRKANSINHQGDGQNVLYGDGHVEFTQSPFVGVNRDNIFTANGPELEDRKGARVTIVASPADANDSILLPTRADVGDPVFERKPVTPGDPAALASALKGTFGRRIDGKDIVVTISESDISITRDGQTHKYAYKALGTRGHRTAIEVTLGEHKVEAEVATTGQTVLIDGPEELAELSDAWVRRQ